MIPVTLGGSKYSEVIPDFVASITRKLRVFIVEDLRSARRFLKTLDKEFPINECSFLEMNEHTPDRQISEFLEPLLEGNDAGIMSEAGMPGIADPGAKLIALAHLKNIKVVPLVGPSSIILALAASGLNGQNFSFNGYLPVKQTERAIKIKELERRSASGFSQIFMETPYRNQKLLEAIVQICNNHTMLCIAADLTLPSEEIRTLPISEWKKKMPDLTKRPVIFILQQNVRDSF